MFPRTNPVLALLKPDPAMLPVLSAFVAVKALLSLVLFLITVPATLPATPISPLVNADIPPAVAPAVLVNVVAFVAVLVTIGAPPIPVAPIFKAPGVFAKLVTIGAPPIPVPADTPVLTVLAAIEDCKVGATIPEEGTPGNINLPKLPAFLSALAA